MTPEKTREVLDIYRKALTQQGYKPVRLNASVLPTVTTSRQHALWMMEETEKFLTDERWDKANRWLGFIQGILWMTGSYTVEQMANHNRTDPKA